jgi:aerobic carbon-monoxide dehydrogenase medium subunit
VTPIAFLRAGSLDEAVEQLDHYGDDAKVVAGSTAVTIMLRQRLIQPAALVSIAGLDELRGISADGVQLELGALTTHREIELSPLVRTALPVLADAFGKVANVRIRNAATVGGVLAEADYASDPPTVLVGLGAEISVRGRGGARSVPAGEFFRGFYETALQPTEVVVGVKVPLPAPGTVARYEKYVSRSSEDRPCVGVFASSRSRPDGGFQDVRVVVGAVAETPQRLPHLEALAAGTGLDDATVGRVADGYADAIDALDDMRGSAWYRRQMIAVWVRRALERVRDEREDVNA